MAGASTRRIEAVSERRATAAPLTVRPIVAVSRTPVAAVVYRHLGGNTVVSMRELAFSCTLHRPRGRKFFHCDWGFEPKHDDIARGSSLAAAELSSVWSLALIGNALGQ